MNYKTMRSRTFFLVAFAASTLSILISCASAAIATDKINAVLVLEDGVIMPKVPKLSSIIAPMIKTELNKGKTIKIVDRDPEAIAEARRTNRKLDGAPYCLSGTITLLPSFTSLGKTASGDEKVEEKTGASLSVKLVSFDTGQILLIEEVSTTVSGDVAAPSEKPDERYAMTPTGQALNRLALDVAKKLETKLSKSSLKAK